MNYIGTLKHFTDALTQYKETVEKAYDLPDADKLPVPYITANRFGAGEEMRFHRRNLSLTGGDAPIFIYFWERISNDL